MMTFSFANSAFAQSWQAKLWGKKPLGKPYVYKRVDGKALHLYVLEPKQENAKAKPAIIFFHGGGWVAGHAGQFNVQAHEAAEGGMIAIEVHYRLLGKDQHASPKVCVEDAKSAVRWVREHATQLGVNPNRIVEAGGSAGGYLAAFATMVPGWNDPHDNLSVSPKADLLILYNPVIDNSHSGYGYKRFGAEYKRYSPYFYITPLAPPMLIMSGTDDKLIHAAVLKTFRDGLLQAGVPCDLILYPGAGHGFFNYPPHLKETTEAMLAFLWKYKYMKEP
jgi:acetyl esterase/lipase